jgi:Flp pilus assembly protein TadG
MLSQAAPMIRPSRSPSRRRRQPASRAQALVELALVMPLMVGIVAVLFQYGILFMSYESVIHMTRDAGRWLSVHPDTQDSDVMLYVTKDMPTSVMFPTQADGPGLHCTYAGSWTCASATTGSTPPNGGLLVQMNIVCGTYNASTKRCMTGTSLSRPAGVAQTVTITYDASSRMFLPTGIHIGWLNVPAPGRYQTYSYYVMVEPE